MNEMNNIRRGKIVEVVSFISGIGLWMVSEFLNEVYKASTYGSDTSVVALIIALIAFSIMIVGKIAGQILCKCPDCGHSVMSRYGNVYKHCPHCGKEIKY